MIVPELLEQALQEVAEDRLKAQIREWIVFTAPVEVQQVYKRYLELLDENEIRIDE
jgi:hypothetical protein